MNTPAHLILGAAICGRPISNAVTWAALAGAMLPDLSLYVMAGFSIIALGISPETVFRELYFSDAWQQVFAVDNSFLLWGSAFALAMWRKVPWAIALCGAALLHIGFDFPLHNEDARMHFWPLTEWKFYSPFSYWDSSSGARIIGVIEVALVAALTVFLWVRFKTWKWRAVFCGIAALQIAPFFMWALFF